MTTQSILMTFDRKQLEFVLENHELFSDNEVKVAAKRIVESGKEEKLRVKLIRYTQKLEDENRLARHDAAGLLL